MRVDHPRRVRLFVVAGNGSGIVFEKRDGSRHTPVQLTDGHEAARSWIEGTYDDVDWESDDRAVAKWSERSEQARCTPSPREARAWEHRPLTHDSDEVRAHLPEMVAGRKGPVILQQCEVYDAESERWEPIVEVLWESTW